MAQSHFDMVPSAFRNAGEYAAVFFQELDKSGLSGWSKRTLISEISRYTSPEKLESILIGIFTANSNEFLGTLSRPSSEAVLEDFEIGMLGEQILADAAELYENLCASCGAAEAGLSFAEWRVLCTLGVALAVDDRSLFHRVRDRLCRMQLPVSVADAFEAWLGPADQAWSLGSTRLDYLFFLDLAQQCLGLRLPADLRASMFNVIETQDSFDEKEHTRLKGQLLDFYRSINERDLTSAENLGYQALTSLRGAITNIVSLKQGLLPFGQTYFNLAFEFELSPAITPLLSQAFKIFQKPRSAGPLNPRWRSETVVALAEGIYVEQRFDRLPILADALEEAECDSPEVLGHCRGVERSSRGDWVIDWILEKR